MGVVRVKKLCAAGCDVQVRQGVPRPDPFTTSAPHSVSGAEVLLGFTWADSPRESPHVTETPSPDIHIPCALRHTGLQARAAPNGHTEHRSVAPCRRGPQSYFLCLVRTFRINTGLLTTVTILYLGSQDLIYPA